MKKKLFAMWFWKRQIKWADIMWESKIPMQGM